VPIWGYATSATAAAQVPGPTLVAVQGESVTVVLHNALPATATGASSLSFPSQALAPDRVGAAPGGTKSYTFTAAQPGTSLYQAGFAGNGPVQTAMGLVGALVVRPSACAACIYDAASAFDYEAVMVVTEVDPALNTSANPANFEMRAFDPKYRLFNGAGHPNIDQIGVQPGKKIALRWVNAGLLDHSLGLLGLHQTVLGLDARPLKYAYRAVAETVPAGASQDSLVTVPSTATHGTRFAVYDAAQRLDNSGLLLSDGTIGFGGALTFIAIDTQGPVTSAVSVVPTPTNGLGGATLSASISDTTSGGSLIAAAEYSIDTVAAPGSGTPMSGSFTSTSVAVTANISAATLSGLAVGTHKLYVRGKDAAGNWGAPASTILIIDRTGPTASNLSLNPASPTNATSVTLTATITDPPNGSGLTAAPASNIAAAEYSVDSPAAAGAGAAMSGTFTSATVVVSANVPIGALTPGTHTLYVRGKDVAGNWGATAAIGLIIDRTGPTATIAPLTSPTNASSVPLSATITDPPNGSGTTAAPPSAIGAAEYFLDVAGAAGTGTAMSVVASTTTPGTATATATVSAGLTPGTHTLYVRGKDVAGNWGATAAATLIIDRTGPTISNATVSPNPRGAATSLTLSATATDPVNGTGPTAAPGSNVVAAEWFRGTDPGLGLATAVTVSAPPANPSTLTATISTTTPTPWPSGPQVISIRAKDAAGNWGPVTTVTVN
jgi:hypothetical protein